MLSSRVPRGRRAWWYAACEVLRVTSHRDRPAKNAWVVSWKRRAFRIGLDGPRDADVGFVGRNLDDFGLLLGLLDRLLDVRPVRRRAGRRLLGGRNSFSRIRVFGRRFDHRRIDGCGLSHRRASSNRRAKPRPSPRRTFPLRFPATRGRTPTQQRDTLRRFASPAIAKRLRFPCFE